MSGTSRSLSVGDRIGGYQILGLIGAGGMGVVYKALDLKLERTVALKFLPHDLNIEERDKERFLREAKAASALDHTNIGVIHGLEESGDGQLFIVMAYYEGETLAQRIKRGPLPATEAVDIAIQIVRGLVEAHGRQIVHRDIKPSNVIRTGQNIAKIVDFGLARVVTSASATQSLGTTGTLAYMSPEQAAGKPVDQRTDIWALGVTLAEMLTGRNPFLRDDAHAVLFAILNQPPAAMGEVPLELQQIIYRALSKDPAKRYQGCQEMLADLEKVRAGLSERARTAEVDDAAPTQSIRPKDFEKYVEHASSPTWGSAVAAKPRGPWWIAAGSVVLLIVAVLALPSARERVAGYLFASEEKHIAVLPFDNIGNNPANEAIAEGLMDSLTSRLSNLEVGKQSLWVVPASVVRSRKVDDPTAALRVLGATLVVKGSIQREGQDVHLTVNLINAKTMRQIGSLALEDRTGDIATLQDETVARLSKLMGIVVTPEMLKATGGKVNPAAYESYLKALGYIQRYDKPGNLDLAISALNAAVKADPRFALGFAELGEAYRLKFQVDQNPTWIEEASASCQKAAELDDRLPAAFVTLAGVHSGVGKYDLALQEYQHALQLNPRDPDALKGLAAAYERVGRIADAEATFKRAAALRPDYWDGYNSLGLFYDRQKRYDDARAQYRRVLELTPDNALGYSNMAVSYLNSGDAKNIPNAEKALEKSVELSPSYSAYANLGFLYLQEKRYAESAAMTEKALQLNDKDFRVWANLGLAYRWLKQDDKARVAGEQELKLLEAISKVKSQDPEIQSELGDLYALAKQRDKAIPRMETALALAPDDPRILSDVGEAYEYLGERRQALQYIHKAFQKGYSLEDLERVPGMEGLMSDPNFRPATK